MTLATNLRSLADFKHSLVCEGPDFVRRVERRCNGSDIFIGALVTDEGETFPDIDLAAEDESVLGIVEGYTNRDLPNATYGYWYYDGDVPFADNKWVIVGILTPGQVVWVCSTADVDIKQGEYLKCAAGLVQRCGTDSDAMFKAMEGITAVASTTQYLRAQVVHS